MYYVGIDVSKQHHDATVIDATSRTMIAPFRFPNTRQGVTTLLTQLQALDAPLQIAMEATGHYWLPLYEALMAHAYPVAVFNPFQIKAYRQVSLRKTKTDAVDSPWIADCGLAVHSRWSSRLPRCDRCENWPAFASPYCNASLTSTVGR